MTEDWRLFAAIQIPETIQRRVAAAAQYLGRAGCHARWVAPEQAHITLKFLGETAQDRIPSVRAAIREAVSDIRRLDLETSGLGAFPSPRRARVLWLGVDGDLRRLQQLHAAIDQRLETVGFDPEEHRFHGHITIGRVRPGNASLPDDLPQILAGGPVRPPLDLPVSIVTLFRSELQRSGPIYHVVDQFSLGGPS